MKISTTTSFIQDSSVMDSSFAVLSEVGFDAVDLDVFSLSSAVEAFVKYDCEDFKRYFKGILETANKNRLEITQINAPLLLMTDDSDMELLKQSALKSIYAASYLCAPYVVFRAGIRESFIFGLDFPTLFKTNYDFFTSLVCALKDTGVTVCIENMLLRKDDKFASAACPRAEFMAKLIDELNGENGGEYFAASLDTGHAFTPGNSPAETVRKLGNRVKTVHIRDNAALPNNYLVPGLGRIDWRPLIDALADIDYRGTCNFEATDYFYSPDYTDMNTEDVFRASASRICMIGKSTVEYMTKYKKSKI